MEHCFLHLVVDELQCASADIVFPAWCENIDYQGVLDCGCSVFHATPHDEGVTPSKVDRFSLACDPDVPVYDIHDLFARVAVYGANPAFHHLVLRKKQFVVVGKHAAFQPTFRR